MVSLKPATPAQSGVFFKAAPPKKAVLKRHAS